GLLAADPVLGILERLDALLHGAPQPAGVLLVLRLGLELRAFGIRVAHAYPLAVENVLDLDPQVISAPRGAALRAGWGGSVGVPGMGIVSGALGVDTERHTVGPPRLRGRAVAPRDTRHSLPAYSRPAGARLQRPPDSSGPAQNDETPSWEGV